MKYIYLILILLSYSELNSQEVNLFCQKCGTEQTIQNVFCKNCGVKIDKTNIIKKIENKIDSLYNLNQFPLSKEELKLLIEENKKIEKPIEKNNLLSSIGLLGISILIILLFPIFLIAINLF